MVNGLNTSAIQATMTCGSVKHSLKLVALQIGLQGSINLYSQHIFLGMLAYSTFFHLCLQQMKQYQL